MAETKGPYPDELDFERYYEPSPVFQRSINDHILIVNFLPRKGWGFVLLRDDFAVCGHYDMAWSAHDAKQAAIEASKPEVIRE